MVPRAEIAHWLAGSAVLLLGLVLLSEVIVGTEVFRRRRWRAYLWPSLALAGGVLLWVIVGVLDVLDDAPGRARRLGAGGDGRRRGPARDRAGEARVPALAARHLGRPSALRGRIRPARAERLALLALGVPPPRPRVDAHRRRRSSRWGRRSGRGGRSSRRASRSRSWSSPSCSSQIATSHRSSATSRIPPAAREAGARRCGAPSWRRSSSPRRPVRTRRWTRRSPGTQSRVSSPPTEVRLRFNSEVTVTSNAIRVFAPDGRMRLGSGPKSRTAAWSSSRPSRGSRADPRTRCAGA